MKIQSTIKYGIILLSIVLSWIIFFFCSDETLINLTLEDHFFEWIGFFFMLAASIIFLVTFIRNMNGNDLFFFKTGKNYFYLLLALGFFFAAMEEISWGQRVFGMQTPAVLHHLNDQQESNIHNLKVFHGLLNFDHFFTMFWMTFCVLIPIINRKSPVASKFFKRVNLPIVPLWLTTFFVLTYSIFLVIKFSLPDILHPISEVKETSISSLFFVLSIVGLIENNY